MNNQHAGLLAAVLLLASLSAHAALGNTNDTDSLNINISGTVVANGSCTFNQGGTLQVDFGEVKLKSTGTDSVTLDGDYQRSLASDIYCEGDTAGLLQMKFSSASGSYETYESVQVLAADKKIVGVELLVNGEPQTMDAWFTVDQNAPPVLKAKLVQLSATNSEKVVSGDVFSASGTLTLAFN